MSIQFCPENSMFWWKVEFCGFYVWIWTPPHPLLHILLNLKLLGSYLKIGRSKITSISAFRSKLFKLYRTTFWQAVWVNLCRKSIVLLADVQDWLHYRLRNRSWVSFPGCDHQTRPPLSHSQSQASSNLEPSFSSSPFFIEIVKNFTFPKEGAGFGPSLSVRPRQRQQLFLKIFCLHTLFSEDLAILAKYL